MHLSEQAEDGLWQEKVYYNSIDAFYLFAAKKRKRD